MTWFLNALFADLAEAGHHFYIWTLADRASQFFLAAGEAVRYAEGVYERTDTYVGMGAIKDPPKSGRGIVADVTGISCMWADIDIADGKAHKKKNIPATEAEAMEILASIGRPPSFVVRSGFGLHAYWLLTEAWVFADAGGRGRAVAFCKRWGATIRAAAKAKGLDVDSVSDITRVLRLPGTLNLKGKPPRAVELQALIKPARYTLDDLEAVMVAEELAAPAASGRVHSEVVGHLTLNPGAVPDPEKFEALKANNNKFRATWDRQRTDLQDQSPSAFDMALANMACEAGWTDQQVADLLIYFRRKSGADQKLRLDYYQRTIAKARTGRASRTAASELAEMPPPSCADPAKVDPSERRAVLDKVGLMLGLNIARWIKQGKENANFTLALVDGTEIPIGTSAAVLSQNIFAARVHDHANVCINRLKETEWRMLQSRLCTIVEIVENPESSRQQTIVGWLQSYAPSSVIFKGDEWAKALAGNHPFEKEGCLHIHAGSLRKWLRLETGEKVDRGYLWDLLRAVGAVSISVSSRVDDKVCTRGYWRFPEDVFGKEGGQ